MTRQAARVDGNQAEIVAALRRAGCSVAITSGVGHGFPDLVVGVGVEDEARTLLMEVKRPGERLTPDEARWHDAWRGHVAIVYSIDDALRSVGRL